MYHAVGIFGDTCSGKSTLGIVLGEFYEKCNYISFGDLKRIHILNQDYLGVEMSKFLINNLPIPPEIGIEVLRGHFKAGINILNGFPISVNELNVLTKMNVSIDGIVCLNILNDCQEKRFSNRVECPICNMPGVSGESCAKHGIKMFPRVDCASKELLIRRKMYENRIRKFLDSVDVQKIPSITCDGEKDANEVFDQVSNWLEKNFPISLFDGV
jgi:adenylate kinase family enzyme